VSHRAFVRFRLISIALFVFGLVSVAVAFNATTAQEAKQRVIVRMPVEKGEPIEITDIKVNGQSVSLNKAFSADDDWLRNLVMSVRNKSDKVISYASINLRFPRPPSSQEVPAIHDMSYGNSALTTRQPSPQDPVVGISPGEIVEIRLSNQQFVALRDFLSAIKYSSSIERIDLGVGHIIFADDTMWYGEAFQRDPNDPRTWIPSRPNSKPR
jgi:hypothetical protein